MFGLGIPEITLILVAAAIIYFLYWKSRKNKASISKD